MLNSPGDDSVAHYTYAVSVGDHHGPLEEARLLDPGRTGHLTVAVLGEPAGKRVAQHGGRTARQHRCNAGPDRSFAHHELAAARDERRMADQHAVDIGYRVERAWR